jgi:phosphatidylglycerol---prolipoprotein diacylglyceryl transferase
MQQVLFHVGPLPIFGYGMMLFLAFVASTWLAGRLSPRAGIPSQRMQDLAIWLFIFGIIGARITYMIVDYHGEPIDLGDVAGKFFKIWEGGLVFYGAAIGGFVGYWFASVLPLRRYHLFSWKMADVVAPCAALGLAVGRIGCLLNGCCYGNVACPDCPALRFPLSAPPRYQLVESGYQTTAGFTLKENAGGAPTVDKVEPGSAADKAGLQTGDRIVRVDGQEVVSDNSLASYLGKLWPRGKNDLSLSILRSEGARPGVTQLKTLPAFSPWTIGLHPTQVYETISMVLLLGVMLLYWPFRRRDGELMVIFMLGYAVHRFLDELLRDDPRGKLFAGMTISENGSILLLIAGLVLLVVLWRRPRQYRLVADSEAHSPDGSAQVAPAGF